ncbi:hypothetical protein BH18ACT12_BH18ACT12_15490 [soil metagenome]
MFLVARDERELHLGLADRHVHAFAVVLDLDEVPSLLRNE